METANATKYQVFEGNKKISKSAKLIGSSSQPVFNASLTF